MTNLWEETMRMLVAHGKTFENVEYVLGSNFGITKENFEKVTKKSDYDSGFGAARVAEDLVVVGDNWWVERHEDGSVTYKLGAFYVVNGLVEYLISDINTNEIEVIGNVYETPEFLGEEE